METVWITGAAGFLGSALTVALSRAYRVVALDWRVPSLALQQAAPAVRRRSEWEERNLRRESARFVFVEPA